MTSNFELLVQKDKERNPKNIKNVNLKNYIGDKVAVDEKYVGGGYEFSTQLQRPSTFEANCDILFMNALLELVSDYNGQHKGGYAETIFEN